MVTCLWVFRGAVECVFCAKLRPVWLVSMSQSDRLEFFSSHELVRVDSPIQPSIVVSFYFAQSGLYLLFNIIGSSPARFV